MWANNILKTSWAYIFKNKLIPKGFYILCWLCCLIIVIFLLDLCTNLKLLFSLLFSDLLCSSVCIILVICKIPLCPCRTSKWAIGKQQRSSLFLHGGHWELELLEAWELEKCSLHLNYGYVLHYKIYAVKWEKITWIHLVRLQLIIKLLLVLLIIKLLLLIIIIIN